MKKALSSILVLGVVLTMIGVLLAGCQSTSTDSTSTDTSTTSSGSGESSGSENNGSTDIVTIELFNQKTEIVGILEGLIAEYEAQNPNVKINLTTVADAFQVLQTRMLGGDTPDIFTHWPSSPFFAQVDAGYVMDLSGTGIMEQVQEAAREQWKYNGGEYAAPISYNVSGIWYNKDIFEAVGINDTPKTWDELIADCETLVAAGYTPFMTVGKDTGLTQRQLQVFMASSLANFDSLQEEAINKSVDINKDYGADIVNMGDKMAQIIKYSQADILGTDTDSATANFANGQAAMYINGSWAYASVTSANPDIKIAMMPIPGDTADLTNTCAYPGDMTLCISSTTKAPQEAIDFVKWMTTTEIANKYAEQEGNPSCIIGVDYIAQQFSDLYADYVTSGKFILNPDASWSSAQQTAAATAVQQLYYDLDSATFAENLQAAFNDN